MYQNIFKWIMLLNFYLLFLIKSQIHHCYRCQAVSHTLPCVSSAHTQNKQTNKSPNLLENMKLRVTINSLSTLILPHQRWLMRIQCSSYFSCIRNTCTQSRGNCLEKLGRNRTAVSCEKHVT